ncbi:hypothetical protein BDR26DRAFT_1005193 [Obelidium mucronatum]|nr:hypothetical protein BDR26DRAFT_1005193 [Obelidium mucronatum]
MSTIDLNHSLGTRISPEDPCWANWFAQEAAPPVCEAGRCADHFKVRVNFEDVTKTVNQPLERKTLTAAQIVDYENNMSFETINLPVIDITALLHHTNGTAAEASAEMHKTAADILKALSDVGAFQAKLSLGGDSRNCSDTEIFETCDSLFAIDSAEKKKCSEKRGGFVRGFLGMGDESGGSALEVKEAFSYGGSTNTTTNKLQGPNLFPPSLSHSNQSNLLKYHSLCASVSRAITRALALAGVAGGGGGGGGGGGNDKDASKDSNKFIPHVDRIGSSAHTDWGFLTLIRSTKPGLQIALSSSTTTTKNGAAAAAGGGDTQTTTVWKTVVPEQDCFIVNAGDYLSVITNGKIISPLHRVISFDLSPSPGVTVEESSQLGRGGGGGGGSHLPNRTSLVFFYYPPYETIVPPDFDFMKEAAVGDVDGAIALERIKNLSLFRDQSEDATAGRHHHVLDLKKVSFGDYISSKWESVARTGASY